MMTEKEMKEKHDKLMSNGNMFEKMKQMMKDMEKKNKKEMSKMQNKE